MALEHAVLERHRRRDLERELVAVHRVERAVVERGLEVDEREARQHAFGRRLADALLDTREEALRNRTADDLAPRTRRPPPGSARARSTRRRTSRGHRSASCSGRGTLVVPRIVSRVRDRGRPGDDRGPELALEPLADDGDVRLADRPQDLLAGLAVRSTRARRLLVEHPLQRRAHLVQIALGQGIDRHLERSGSGRRSPAGQGASRDPSVSPVSVTPSFAIAPISPALKLGRRLLLLAVEESSWPMRSSSPWWRLQTSLGLSVPDRTRRYVSLPTNGSAEVLNTRTRSGPSVGRRDRDVLARPCPGLHRGLLVGRREVPDDGVKQRGAGRSPWPPRRRAPGRGSDSRTPL